MLQQCYGEEVGGRIARPTLQSCSISGSGNIVYEKMSSFEISSQPDRLNFKQVPTGTG